MTKSAPFDNKLGDGVRAHGSYWPVAMATEHHQQTMTMASLSSMVKNAPLNNGSRAMNAREPAGFSNWYVNMASMYFRFDLRKNYLRKGRNYLLFKVGPCF